MQNQDFYNIISGFKTLREFQEFLEEKADKGEQVSRGMTDKMSPDSKAEKKKEQVVTKEVEKKANGAEKETHYDYQDTAVEEPQEPEEQPPMPVQPGQQVAIGNKEIQDDEDPKTVKITISGKKEKIIAKPRVRTDDSTTSNK